MTRHVWIHVDPSRPASWCVLVSAYPGGRITTGCSAFDYREVALYVGEPDWMCCPACVARVESGRLQPAEPLADDDLAISRTATVDIARRPPSDPPEAWTSQWEPPSKEHGR